MRVALWPAGGAGSKLDSGRGSAASAPPLARAARARSARVWCRCGLGAPARCGVRRIAGRRHPCSQAFADKADDVELGACQRRPSAADALALALDRAAHRRRILDRERRALGPRGVEIVLAQGIPRHGDPGVISAWSTSKRTMPMCWRAASAAPNSRAADKWLPVSLAAMARQSSANGTTRSLASRAAKSSAS